MESTVWFENGQLDKQRTTLQAVCTAQPVLRFRSFLTKRSWPSDPFVLFQNGIRHEIQDLFIMLRSAAFRVDALQAFECVAFQKWFVEFSQMVSLYFLVQEKVIYPAVNMHAAETISVDTLREKTTPLLGALVSIHAESLRFLSACRARGDGGVYCSSDSVHTPLETISRLVFSFVAELENLFSWELETLVPIVTEKLSRKEARAIERKSVLEMISYDVGETTFAAYARWLPAQVKAQYLIGVDLFKMRRLRAKERRWSRTHKALQTQFACARP